jgi:hypothetical protein
MVRYGCQDAAIASISAGFGNASNLVGILHRSPDSEVAAGQHIHTPQREHQEHLRRPHADAFHLREVRNHRLRHPSPAGLRIRLSHLAYAAQVREYIGSSVRKAPAFASAPAAVSAHPPELANLPPPPANRP